jgi:hypothetical protein
MDRELLRHLLFEYLKTVENAPNTQLSTIYGSVATLAVEGGHFPRPNNFVPGSGFLSVEILPESDRLILQELTWEMIIQGVLAPGSDWSNPNLPFVRITEYGRRCLAESTILPHDYGTYLETIKQVTPSTDPTFLLYLTESVEAFNKALYISCTVNLGIASEQLTILLVDAYKAAISSVANRTKFEQAINKQRHIAYQFEELFKRLVANKAAFPADIADNLDMIKFLEEIIRKERNDAGHPTGRTFTREEALVLLIAFPAHYKTVIKLLDWLKANPNTI